MKNAELLNNVLNVMVKYAKWFILLAVVAVFCSGIIFVQPDEVAIIVRLGKVVGDTPAEQVKQPGLHFAFPYVIDTVIKVPVGKIRETQIISLFSEGRLAYVTEYYGVGKYSETKYYYGGEVGNIVESGYAITGDDNIILIDAVVKYKITDALKFALEVENPDKTIQGVVTSILAKHIRNTNVDSVLTDKKIEIAAAVTKESQVVFDDLGLGIQINNLEFRTVSPPIELDQAFDDVITANIQKETMIQEANRYTETVLPAATAEADALVKKAETRQHEAVAKANNDVSEFYGLIEEYKKNKEVVKERIYRDKVDSILSKIGSKIVIPESGETPNIFLP